MPEETVFKWLESGFIGQSIAQSPALFPAIETVHVIALALVVGSIAVLDLRLLGVSWRTRPVTELASDILAWTWTSFAVAVATGSLLFLSAATKYAANGPFQLKMILLMLAGVNMLAFHLGPYRGVAAWDRDPKPPLRVRVAAGLSLFFWVSIVTCGRWIGFV